jgi:hypothetical protein
MASDRDSNALVDAVKELSEKAIMKAQRLTRASETHVSHGSLLSGSIDLNGMWLGEGPGRNGACATNNIL